MTAVVFVLSMLASFLLWATPSSRILRTISPGKSEAARFEGIDDVPLLLDLLASLLEVGASLSTALARQAQVCSMEFSTELATVSTALAMGMDWSAAWAHVPVKARDGPLQQLELALKFTASTGAPSSALLRAEARQIRRAAHRELQQRAAVLSVKLVLPMGLCALPAFICLGVVPVLLALLPAQ